MTVRKTGFGPSAQAGDHITIITVCYVLGMSFELGHQSGSSDRIVAVRGHTPCCSDRTASETKETELLADPHSHADLTARRHVDRQSFCDFCLSVRPFLTILILASALPNSFPCTLSCSNGSGARGYTMISFAPERTLRDFGWCRRQGVVCLRG